MVNEPPAYPSIARVRGWEGEVTLIAYVNDNGYVYNVDVLSSSGHRTLDQAAVKAISKWKFRVGGKPSEVKIPINFVLE